MNIWRRQPISVKVCGTVLVLLCLVDFTQRIWVSADIASRSTTDFKASMYTVSTPDVSETIQTFLSELERNQEVSPETTDQEAKDKIPLIEGGVNLGDMRVRVRAIYTSAATNKKTALIEAQNITERNLELTEVGIGYTLNNYQVSEITVDSVVFTGSDQSDPITIPVFDY